MNCQQCGAELPVEQGGGHRLRVYCNQACRQKHYREQIAERLTQHQQDQDAAISAEVATLRTKVVDQTQEIDELTSQITDLRNRLDIERRYLSDIKPYTFKAWLKKQEPGPLVTCMFADPLFPPRGPRSLYEAHVRAHYGPVERDDFVRLWKLMLLQS